MSAASGLHVSLLLSVLSLPSISAQCNSSIGNGHDACGSINRITLLQGDSSHSANRANLVLLADGYTASQTNQFLADANTWRQNFFSIQPFKDYQQYFNVYLVSTTSTQSGATICDGIPSGQSHVTVQNYFGSSYGVLGDSVSVPGMCNSASSNTATDSV